MRHVVLFLLGAHLACARTHSMRYFYTGVSGISDFPEFTAVALVDDEQFMFFDSNTKKAVPKTEWIRQNVGEDYWNGETKIFTGTYPAFKINIQNLKKLFNQSAGVHTWQQMCGCELDDDGTKLGYWQYGYDGEDFLSLDKSTLTWTAASPQAVLTKHKWEVNRAIIEQQKAYLENTCIEWLQKYVRYGKETLERKVQCGGPLSIRLSVNTRVWSTHGSSYFFIWMLHGAGLISGTQEHAFSSYSSLRLLTGEVRKFLACHQSSFSNIPHKVDSDCRSSGVSAAEVFLVSCHATGFYPSGVTISWQKNGQEHHEDVYLAELLPNEDGTFQRTSTIKVSPEELKKNQFSCVVEHQGETFRSILKAPVPFGFILAAVTGVFLLIVTAVAGYKVYQKKKGFKPVNASDDGSNGSARSDTKT